MFGLLGSLGQGAGKFWQDEAGLYRSLHHASAELCPPLIQSRTSHMTQAPPGGMLFALQLEAE